jgi:hypothetical protein
MIKNPDGVRNTLGSLVDFIIFFFEQNQGNKKARSNLAFFIHGI